MKSTLLPPLLISDLSLLIPTFTQVISTVRGVTCAAVVCRVFYAVVMRHIQYFFNLESSVGRVSFINATLS